MAFYELLDRVTLTIEAMVPNSEAMPRALSDIILHLMEKELDRRYQNAERLIHDLSCLQCAPENGEVRVFLLGARDFARRHSLPSRPVGQATEIGALEATLQRSPHGKCRGVPHSSVQASAKPRS
jgi:serine/threonine protein kinase